MNMPFTPPVLIDLERFKALPSRDQARLVHSLIEASDFSMSRSYDALLSDLDGVAEDLAEDDGFEGDDLAGRYLAPDARIVAGMPGGVL